MTAGGLRVSGTLELSLVGILLGIADILTEAGIPVFVASAYDSDYVLVEGETLDSTLNALSAPATPSYGGAPSHW